MSIEDDAAARRAAAAEARRQKILARGAERLNRITVGAPLSADASNTAPSSTPSESTSPEMAPTIAAFILSESQTHDASTKPAASEPQLGIHQSSSQTDQPQRSMPDVETAAEQKIPVADTAPTDDDAQQQLRTAQREAEQALHALLNQLAGSTASQLMTANIPSPPTSSNAAVGSRTGSARPGTDDAQHATSSAAASGQATGTIPRIGGEAPRRGPETDSPGGSVGRSRSSGVLAVLVAAVVAALFGPQLSAAVEATRRLRCCTAVALAVLLHSGVVDAGHLQVPPILALLATQMALIVAARMLGGGSASGAARTPLGKVSPDQQRPTAEDGYEGEGGGGGGGETAAPPPPMARSDWLSVVPGLRPVLDRVTSAAALVSGLYGDVAVFLVSYIVLGAWGQLSAAS